MNRFFSLIFSRRSARTGFTLVELIIVAAIFAVIGGIAVGFFISVITGRARSQARIDLQENARVLETRIAYEARRARGFEVTSDFNVNLATISGATLDLDQSSAPSDPTTFSITSGIAYVKYGASAAVPLTTNEVTITDFTFQNRSSASGRSKQLAYTITLTAPSPTGTGANITYTLSSSVELRGK